MEYTRLGGSGLVISRLVVGTAFVGSLVDRSTLQEIVKSAWELGINTFDTADCYPVQTARHSTANGAAEILLGEIIKHRRDAVVLCTKVMFRPGSNQPEMTAVLQPDVDYSAMVAAGAWPNSWGLSRKHIVSAVEHSLRRLQTNYIDLYQLHGRDPATPLEETLEALDDLVRCGKVRYVGCSEFQSDDVEQATAICAERRLHRLISMQVSLNLLNTDRTESLRPITQRSVSLLVFNSLAAGLLTGTYDRRRVPDESSRLGIGGYVARIWNERNLDFVDKLVALGADLGRSPIELAQRWVLAQPGVAALLGGPETSAQLIEMATVFDRPLLADEAQALEHLLRSHTEAAGPHRS